MSEIVKLLDMLREKCPGCNFLGHPGITVLAKYDHQKHYNYTEKVPCRWCEARKRVEVELGEVSVERKD